MNFTPCSGLLCPHHRLHQKFSENLRTAVIVEKRTTISCQYISFILYLISELRELRDQSYMANTFIYWIFLWFWSNLVWYDLQLLVSLTDLTFSNLCYQQTNWRRPMEFSRSSNGRGLNNIIRWNFCAWFHQGIELTRAIGSYRRRLKKLFVGWI